MLSKRFDSRWRTSTTIRQQFADDSPTYSTRLLFDEISITPTGLSSYNINAPTLHSVFSTKTPNISQKKYEFVRNLIGQLQLLIIDEISMVEAENSNINFKNIHSGKQYNKFTHQD